MCLRVTDLERKTAEKDITVYKMLYQTTEGILLTPFEKATVEIGKSYSSSLEKPDFKGDVSIGLHSFVNFHECKKESEDTYFEPIDASYDRIVIAECCVPKGSEYYEGTFENTLSSIASDRLKYIKLL